MRIVAGSCRGRRIKVPAGRDVRPTADRVREAVFSSLGAHVEGAAALDLFAGSGALGLEALSRGADTAVFVERSSATFQVLKENIDNTGLGSRSRLVRGDAITAVRRLASKETFFNLVFLDPPYASKLLERVLLALVQWPLLAPGALIVAEHDRDRQPVLPPSGELRITSTRTYGSTSISMISKPPTES